MPDAPREDWHCAHCGKRSGMYGHAVILDMPHVGLCPRTVELIDGRFHGFLCAPGHTCADNAMTKRSE